MNDVHTKRWRGCLAKFGTRCNRYRKIVDAGGGVVKKYRVWTSFVDEPLDKITTRNLRKFSSE